MIGWGVGRLVSGLGLGEGGQALNSGRFGFGQSMWKKEPRGWSVRS